MAERTAEVWYKEFFAVIPNKKSLTGEGSEKNSSELNCCGLSRSFGKMVFGEWYYLDYNLWMKDFPAAITICDNKGLIMEMNDKACKHFAEYGGKDLIGKNVLDCHPEAARKKLEEMLEREIINCYTIEKNNIKKLIYQAPWYEAHELKGIVEWVIDLPLEIPHFLR